MAPAADPRFTATAGVFVVALLAVSLAAAATVGDIRRQPPPRFLESFEGKDGLVASEFANQSTVWDVNSGSLFRRAGRGWTGALGGAGHSEVFRVTTRQRGFGDGVVRMRLEVLAFGSTASTPATAWDGVHVLVRMAGEEAHYAVSVFRRDGTAAVKRKVPGGPSNGGTYTTLATGPSPVAVGRRHMVEVSVEGDELRLAVDGKQVLTAVDEDAPAVLRRPGAVALRGDNCEFEVDDVAVHALG